MEGEREREKVEGEQKKNKPINSNHLEREEAAISMKVSQSHLKRKSKIERQSLV